LKEDDLFAPADSHRPQKECEVNQRGLLGDADDKGPPLFCLKVRIRGGENRAQHRRGVREIVGERAT